MQRVHIVLRTPCNRYVGFQIKQLRMTSAIVAVWESYTCAVHYFKLFFVDIWFPEVYFSMILDKTWTFAHLQRVCFKILFMDACNLKQILTMITKIKLYTLEVLFALL